MARITRAHLDHLAQALSELHGADIWIQHSSLGYAIQQTIDGGTGAWQHAGCLTASEAKQWLSGALSIHSITCRAADPAAH